MTSDSGPPSRWFVPATVAVFVGLLGLLLAQAWLTPMTVDEPSYLRAGIHLRTTLDWQPYYVQAHGPLPFYANQLLAWLVPAAPDDSYRFAARVGMLLFPLLAAFATFWLALRAFGRAAGFAALWLFATNPMLLGHGALAATDMSLVGFYVLCLFAAWRCLEAPSWTRTAAIGVALGLAMATKYLAVFLVPVLAMTFGCALIRGFRPQLLWSRVRPGFLWRLLDTALLTLACGLAAWVVLWACYLFVPHGYPADHVPMSHFVTALRQLPMATSALHALPEPWVRGIDYMAAYSETGGAGYLHGRIGPGFWDYYLLALATKMPAPLLLLLPVALLWRQPRWPRGLPMLVAAGIAVPLAWLSLKQSLQIGLRHMLQVIPLLIVVAAQPLGRLWDHGLRGSRRAGRALVSVLLAGSAASLLHAWPDCIGSFNVLTPGPAYQWFRDSNFDWSWKRADDASLQRLLARHPGAGRVYPLSGPRLGLVYAHGADLCQSADAQGRADHWLRRFAPVDHERGWYAFEVDAAAFAAQAAAHPEEHRLQLERASALVTSGAPQQGLDALATTPGAEDIRRAATLALAGQTGSPDYVDLLQRLGRFDLAQQHPAATLVQRAQSRMAQQDYEGVRQLLLDAERTAGASGLSAEATLQLAYACYNLADYQTARDALQRGMPTADEHNRQLFQFVIKKLDYDQAHAWSTLGR